MKMVNDLLHKYTLDPNVLGLLFDNRVIYLKSLKLIVYNGYKFTRLEINFHICRKYQSTSLAYSQYAPVIFFQISWADVHFQNWLDFPNFQLKLPLDLSKYPKLEALKKRVENHPKIAEWIAKRPC